MGEPVGIPERPGQQATGEQAIGEQAIGEQASGEQATGEQTTREQATGEQAIQIVMLPTISITTSMSISSSCSSRNNTFSRK